MFDIDIYTVQNCDNHYKKFKQSGKEVDKNNFKYVKLLIKKLLIVRKSLLRRENCRKERTILKNFGRL